MTTQLIPSRPATTLYANIQSPIGELLVTGQEHSSGFAVTGIYFPAHKHPPQRAADWELAPESFSDLQTELKEYFAGKRTAFSSPLSPRGTPFQQSVWSLLRSIPFGETRTYQWLASELGKPQASRAVGAAVGRNPISIVVPCHRVVGTNGKLTGFAGGLDRKSFLLSLEASARVKATQAIPYFT